MEDSQSMTADYQKKFDGAAYAIFKDISKGCSGLSQGEVDTIAQSIFTSPADCKKYSGEFVEAAIQGIAQGESEEGAWDGLYGFAQICNA